MLALVTSRIWVRCMVIHHFGIGLLSIILLSPQEYLWNSSDYNEEEVTKGNKNGRLYPYSVIKFYSITHVGMQFLSINLISKTQ